MEEKIKKEYERLVALFKDIDPAKINLIDELLKKAAFLKVELDNLQAQVKRNGPVEYSSKGNSRPTQCYKMFLTSLGVYQTIIKTLNSILGVGNTDTDDEFDTFLKGINS